MLKQCTKCKEQLWHSPESSIYEDSSGHFYCVFHAPAEHKGVDTNTFNSLVFEKIRTAEKECILNGTIFPGEISFKDVEFKHNIHFWNAVFEDDADFQKVIFQKVASFINAKFKVSVNFSDASFLEKADFTNAKFGDSFFHRATFHGNAIYHAADFFGDTYFDCAEFFLGANFGKARFNCEAEFSNSVFAGEAFFGEGSFGKKTSFLKAKFDELARFGNRDFPGEILFQNVRAKSSALHLHSLSSRSIANVRFTSLETDLFSFRCCKWPSQLWCENEVDNKASEELYRSLKQKAATEHDQLMVSKWHYREKMMALEQLKKSERWRPILSITWWYFVCSGFGEEPTVAFKFLLKLFAVAFLSLCCFKLLETSWSPQPDWTKIFEIPAETLALIPLVKSGAVADPSSVSLVFPIKKFFVSLMQIAVSVQIALFAFALRNRFRR